MICILILIFLFGCFTPSKQCISDSSRFPKKELKTNDNRTEKLLENWKYDKYGCLGFRNYKTVRYIIDTLNIQGKSTNFIIENLGYPNVRKQGEKNENFYYYFNTLCDGDIQIDSADFCWLELLIELDQVKVIDVSCR